MTVRTLIDDGNPCGEGPIWDEIQQRVYWTDCAGRFYSYDWKSGQRGIALENFEVTGCAFDMLTDLLLSIAAEFGFGVDKTNPN